MSDDTHFYNGEIAEFAEADARASFITKTYTHLVGAVAAFILLETVLFETGAAIKITEAFMSVGFVLVLVAFMAVGWVAEKMARSNTAPAVAYGGLALFVVAEAAIFCPILYIASTYYEGVIFQAALVSIALFGALTVAVMMTRKDFSFLGTGLRFAMFGALALIGVSFFTSFTLGLWFSIGMVVLMCGYILYYTSQVLHHYRTDQHVAASLALFSSLATLFWYILQIFMSRE